MKTLRTTIVTMLLVIPLFLLARVGPSAQEPPLGSPCTTDQALIDRLRHETGSKVRISYHAKTGKVRFIGTDLEHTIPQPGRLVTETTPEDAARQFLATYGQLFGLTDQARELMVMRTRTADRGRSFVRFQQIYQGIPVLGGELIVQMDASKNVVSANGEILPNLELDTIPGIDAETARLRGLTKVAKDYSLSVDDLTATEPELWVHSPNLIGGPGPSLTTLVWRIEVQPKELLPIRELVLVDAHLGLVAVHFNQIDAAKNRRIYDNQNNPAYGLPGNGPVRTEGQGPTGITDVDNAYDYAGDTYGFYWNTHGRDSLDNAGMDLISTVRYCPDATDCPYANAFWNGAQMVYGDDYASADDVVAHEMTHGVTQYESNLFYYMQSGAINETFSDMWGEFVDLTNGAGNDTTGVRWLIGEDLPIGALRSMRNPPAYASGLGAMPDRVTSTNYYCGELDNGGVHHNMGVGSKAAYLIVDGDTFNGYTVTGIGIDKTAKIWYEVQTNMFTSAADYQDLYDGLYQACTNLIGTSGITAADCQEVRDATDATEMSQQPASCPATHAPICDSGSPTSLFFDDMENTSSGNWTSAAIVGSNEWYYPQNSHHYTGFDATYATSGVYNIWGYDHCGRADYYIAMASEVTLPANAYLHFNHAYAFDDYSSKIFDGGVVEYSTNGGSSWQDAGSLFTHNGYNGTISSSWNNPLGGQSAFVGESNGYMSSRASLSSLAGQNVRFRFRIGTSNTSNYQRYCAGYGWFIDDVRIYTCPLPDMEVSPTSFDVTLSPGQSTQRTMTIRNVGQGTLSFSISDVETVGSAPPGPTITPPPAGEVDTAGNVVGFAGWDWAALRKGWEASTSVNILYYGSSTEPDRFAALGATVTTITDPSLISEAYLNQFDVFFIGYSAERNYGSLSSKAMAIQNYISGGGGVILEQPGETGYQCQFLPAGFEVAVANTRWPGYPSYYDPLEFTSIGQTHPMLQGLTPDDMSGNFDTVYDSDLGSSYTRLARLVWYPSMIALAVGQYGNGRIVFQTGNLGTNSGVPGSDVYVEQMLEWAAGGGPDAPWLSESPTSGTVPASGSQDITITFDATGLSIDTYTADIIITNNDPDENPVTVPVTLHVGGTTYCVSGYVQDGSGGGINGVTVSFSGNGSTTTDGNGYYSKCGFSNGTYTVTPSKAGCTFDPSSRQVTVSGADVTNVNFTGDCPEGNVDLSIVPSPKNVAVNEIFTVDIQVDAGSQPVDAMDAYLSFDRSYLRVVDADGNETNSIIAGSTLPVVLQNIADNSAGRITYSAGKQLGSPSPSGTFTLATIRFKAMAETTGTTVAFLAGTDVFYLGSSVLGSAYDGTVIIIETPFRGEVALQGRGSAGDPRWENFPLTVTFYPPGGSTPVETYSTTTDRYGVFSVAGASPGTYDVEVKNTHTLSTKRTNVTVPPATDPVNFCTLLEGDANDDDRVAGADFSILVTTYGLCQGETGYDGRADFNGDDCIGGADFSLLATNYGQQGPLPCSVASAVLSAVEMASTVDVSIQPSAKSACVSEIFTLDIQMAAGAQGVDAVDTYLSFDRDYLRVVDAGGNETNSIIAGSTLPLVLQNTADNSAGLITYSAGKQLGSPSPSGTFILATIRLKAIAETPPEGTPITFLGGTDVFYQGNSVLGNLVNGNVVITSTPTFTTYLPLIMKLWPPIPDTPMLYHIINPDGGSNYMVCWSTAARATSYTLEEDDNSAFSSPTIRYSGSGTCWTASDKEMGTYYYRVRASNSWGNSGWSNVQSVSVHQAVSKVYPVGDTTVLQGYSNENFGSTSDMWVGYDHCVGGKLARSLVQFDVSSIPAGTSISQAKLYLYLMNSCDIGERTHTATIYRTKAGWSESAVTWNTRPDYAEAYGSASIPSLTWGWYSFDVTNLVRGWVNGSFPNYGLMIRGPESSGNDSAQLGFATRNASGTTYDPYLSITCAGMATFEEAVPAVEGVPNLTECGPTIKDMLSTSPDASDFDMFEAIEETICSPD